MKKGILKLFLILVFGINHSYCFSDTIKENKKNEIVKIVNKISDLPNVNFLDPEELFNELALKGAPWEKIVNQFLKGLKNDTPAKLKNKAMQNLINYRYSLDFKIYKEAANQLFNFYYFTVVPTSEGFIVCDEAGDLIYKKNYFLLKIYNGYFTLKGPHCIILISITGSKSVTSDLDSSISVKNAEVLELMHLFPNFDNKEMDFNELIKMQIIKKFNEINQKKYGMTSSLSRDSNVYSDGPLKTYPKFNKKVILGNKLIVSNTDKFYEKNRKKRRIYEQAASFLPIKKLAKESNWINFKKNVIKKLESFLPKIGHLNNLPEVKKDFEEICDFTDTLALYQDEKIKEKIETIKNSKYGQNSPLKEDKINWEKDMLIAAMNELYSEHLEIVSILGGKVIALNNKIKKMTKNAEILSAELKNKKKVLKNMYLSKNIKSHVPKLMDDLKKKIGVIEEIYEKDEEAIKNLLLEKADLNNESHLAQIKASLFAYGAYTNSSAPYHVVKGLQGYKEIKITSQIMQGSILQNIGFRLLQSELDRQMGLDEGTIAYKNAKYGQRVADLIFGQARDSYLDNEIELISSFKNKIKILPCLQKKCMKWESLFSREEYHLLNSEIRVIEQVKNKDKIAYDEKGKEAYKLLVKRYEIITGKINPTKEEMKNYVLKNEKELYLSIAAKVIASIYLEKLEKTNNVKL